MSVKSDYERQTGRTLQRMVFINVDARGNYVYRFEWVMSGGAFGGQGGSQTFAVNKTGSSTWNFIKPNYNEETTQEGQDLNRFLQQEGERRRDFNGKFNLTTAGGTSATGQELAAIERGVGIFNRWLEEGRYTEAEAQALINHFATLSDIGDIEAWTNILPPPAGSAGLDNTLGFDDLFGSGSGRGSGSGAVGPVYRAPDRRTIEDQVTGQVVSLLGSVDDDLVQDFTNLFMKEDRRNFDSPDAQIDAGTSVIEAIRNTAVYKTIHKLRPDSVDERTWISRRRSAGESGGLAEGSLEEFGIDQATIGGRITEAAEAGAVKQFVNTNQAPRLLQNQYKTAVADMFDGIVK